MYTCSYVFCTHAQCIILIQTEFHKKIHNHYYSFSSISSYTTLWMLNSKQWNFSYFTKMCINVYHVCVCVRACACARVCACNFNNIHICYMMILHWTYAIFWQGSITHIHILQLIYTALKLKYMHTSMY